LHAVVAAASVPRSANLVGQNAGTSVRAGKTNASLLQIVNVFDVVGDTCAVLNNSFAADDQSRESGVNDVDKTVRRLGSVLGCIFASVLQHLNTALHNVDDAFDGGLKNQVAGVSELVRITHVNAASLRVSELGTTFVGVLDFALDRVTGLPVAHTLDVTGKSF